MIDMGSQEIEHISKFLESNDVHLTSSNTWLKSCINWFRSHEDLANTYTSVEHYVLVQWLLADLEDVQNPCLPSVPSTGKTLLNGKYNAQINWIRDIAQSCYSQLQNVQNNNCESDSNDFISADEPKKQSWEPNPKRVLMMEVTDGVKTMKAMEYSPIPKLVEPFIPGLKVLLNGPIECRNGILFLTNSSITILGGEAEDLHESNRKENILSRCLNIPPNPNQNNGLISADGGMNSRSMNGGHSRPPEGTGSSSRSNLVSNNRSRPPMTEKPLSQNRPVSMAEPERDMFMDEEDDMFLQLPDEMFNNPTDNPSPVLNEISTINSRPQEEPQQVSTFKAPLKLSNKPKLFPFLEESREQSANPPTNDSSTERMDVISKRAMFEVPPTSTSSLHHRKVPPLPVSNTNASGSFSGPFSNKSTFSDSRKVENMSFNGDLSDCILVEEKLFPKFVMTDVKVENITNLKIRNKEWTCTARAMVEGNLVEITFSNIVLEKLFGVSASTMENQKEEMKSNQDLKMKVNARLKEGQNRIKTLHCIMTLEYTSEDCTPSVVSVEL